MSEANKYIPVNELRSITDFKSDADYQAYCKALWAKHELANNSKVNFLVNMHDGKVTFYKRKAREIPVRKISKSDQRTGAEAPATSSDNIEVSHGA